MTIAQAVPASTSQYRNHQHWPVAGVAEVTTPLSIRKNLHAPTRHPRLLSRDRAAEASSFACVRTRIARRTASPTSELNVPLRRNDGSRVAGAASRTRQEPRGHRRLLDSPHSGRLRDACACSHRASRIRRS